MSYCEADDLEPGSPVIPHLNENMFLLSHAEHSQDFTNAFHILKSRGPLNLGTSDLSLSSIDNSCSDYMPSSSSEDEWCCYESKQIT